MSKELIVDGYKFATIEEANEARLEKEKIEKLKVKLANADVELLYKVYNKSLEKMTFKTPIGYSFLFELRNMILNSDIDSTKVLPIPVVSNEVYIKPVVVEEKTKTSNSGAKWFLMIIAMLIVVIIAMFVIMSTSDKPTIINYENKIIDKYAAWEQELSDREAVINEKEKELGIFK